MVLVAVTRPDKRPREAGGGARPAPTRNEFCCRARPVPLTSAASSDTHPSRRKFQARPSSTARHCRQQVAAKIPPIFTSEAALKITFSGSALVERLSLWTNGARFAGRVRVPVGRDAIIDRAWTRLRYEYIHRGRR